MLTLLAVACTGDPAPPAPTEADADTDADADSDTDTDADTDVEPNIPVTYGTPITDGCMAGVTPTTPVAPLVAPTLSQEGELGFTATLVCVGSSWVARFEESRFSDPPTSVVADAWDLSNGTWMGEWSPGVVVGPGEVANTQVWEIAPPPGEPGGCDLLDRTVFTGVGLDNGTPSAPTGTEDRFETLVVPAAGLYTDGDGNQSAYGQVESQADEVWAWALYPEHDQAFGPFQLGGFGSTWDIAFPLTANNLVYQGMAYGFVACEGGQITGVHAR
ncbi:MAG: hypothetical protein H6734_02250 [Alphaproteobacteria bacterium]|nr:hypothetical protein [Alphaproteobacteria bacterium]